MKNLILTIAFISVISFLSAQEKFKFGECPMELLQMTTYDKDSTASAVVLYEKADVRYDVNSLTSDFQIVTEYVVRIKILTQEGISFAEAAIPFYKGKNKLSSEEIIGLTGFTYNPEGDKIVKDKLSKEYIFTEDVTENYKRLKFAMPAVKAGSVIEYKYKMTSPYFYNPEDYVFQRTIPVKYSFFSIRIPEYFKFSKETKGYEPINVKTESVNESFMLGTNRLSCTAEEITVEAKDLPALKEEDFVWNYTDFKSQINFEISSVTITGVYYKDFSNTWSKVVERLADRDDFGKQFNNKGLFKEDLPAALSGKATEIDSIRAILNLVRSKIKWNDRANLYVTNQSKALKEGTGSSADINALLINAFRNAGFEAYPVAMSLRSRGRLPLTHPGSDNLNYFIACVYSGQNTYFLDGTLAYTDINVIPVDCMVDKALIIKSGTFDWIDLSTIGNNLDRVNLSLKFDENGVLSGNVMKSHGGENAFAFKKRYNKAENEQKFVEEMETKDDITISDYKMEEKTAKTFSYVEQYKFQKNNIRLGDNVISFNPLLLFAMKNNSFKPETRKLPVEFPYLQEEKINIMVEIPEGYDIDEIPASQKFIYGENETISFSYIVQKMEGRIMIACTTSLKTCIVPAVDYEGLRDFWAKMYNKQNELITIKKI
jgi:transglutaminase-like putative cysteine protease